MPLYGAGHEAHLGHASGDWRPTTCCPGIATWASVRDGRWGRAGRSPDPRPCANLRPVRAPGLRGAAALAGPPHAEFRAHADRDAARACDVGARAATTRSARTAAVAGAGFRRRLAGRRDGPRLHGFGAGRRELRGPARPASPRRPRSRGAGPVRSLDRVQPVARSSAARTARPGRRAAAPGRPGAISWCRTGQRPLPEPSIAGAPRGRPRPAQRTRKCGGSSLSSASRCRAGVSKRGMSLGSSQGCCRPPGRSRPNWRRAWPSSITRHGAERAGCTASPASSSPPLDKSPCRPCANRPRFRLGRAPVAGARRSRCARGLRCLASATSFLEARVRRPSPRSGPAWRTSPFGACRTWSSAVRTGPRSRRLAAARSAGAAVDRRDAHADDGYGCDGLYGRSSRAELRAGSCGAGTGAGRGRAAALQADGIELIRGDLRDARRWPVPARDATSSITSPPCIAKREHPDSYYRDVNVGGTQNSLLDAAERLRSVGWSTAARSACTATYRRCPPTRSAPFSPGDIYQESKLEAELLASNGSRPACRARSSGR